MACLLRVLRRAISRAPQQLQRHLSSSGSSSDSSTPTRRGPRAPSKGSATLPNKFDDTSSKSSGGSLRAASASSASQRGVRRFVVCEDAPAAAAQQQSFWWAADPAAYVIGIDCSVRSTGYCVLKASAPPLSIRARAADSAALAAPEEDAAAAHCVAACGSISTGVGVASSIDPARFLTDARACLAQVKADVEKEFGAGKWLVVVEDCLIQYQGRRSSADTIVNLARFNALVSGAAPALLLRAVQRPKTTLQRRHRSSSAAPSCASTPALQRPPLVYL
jgi:hypothetical protein